MDRAVLTINSGSSSLKAGLYVGDSVEQRAQRRIDIQAIGSQRPTMAVDGGNAEPGTAATFGEAFRLVLQQLTKRTLDGVGHRVVHGGRRYSEPAVITGSLIEDLRGLVPIDPTHLPQAIELIDTAESVCSGVPQVACFDTAFHRSMPLLAQLEPLPRELFEQGVQRYGFHGLSYEYVLSELTRLDPRAAHERIIVAHLGNGASMAAVREGRSVDTTMGFTPTGGLMMGTRAGDLDPGLLVHLQRARGMTLDELDQLVTRKSGLLAVSGRTSDVRQLLALRGQDEHARQAIDLFCYRARKFVGSLAAALGGLHTLVFTGGIGEHAPPIRESICEELEFLGVELDLDANSRNQPVISKSNGRVTVRVIPTDEDAVIARHTFRTLWP
jgi:acetate kinase